MKCQGHAPFACRMEGWEAGCNEQGRPKRLGRVTNGGLVESKLSFLMMHRKRSSVERAVDRWVQRDGPGGGGGKRNVGSM